MPAKLNDEVKLKEIRIITTKFKYNSIVPIGSGVILLLECPHSQSLQRFVMGGEKPRKTPGFFLYCSARIGMSKTLFWENFRATELNIIQHSFTIHNNHKFQLL